MINKIDPFISPKKNGFTFIDLFAGIGGFRVALQSLGGTCNYSSEWDLKAQETYKKNFGELPYGDIRTEENKNLIPKKFDVLCAGFPCQPFSKGGYRNGFEDTRGTLFFDICEIVERHKPKFVFLENVANLVTHDNKNTYKVILETLDKLGYLVPNKPLLLSPDKFGIPILRQRVYIPCVRKDIAKGKEEYILNIHHQIEKEYVDKLDSIDTVIDLSAKNTITEYEEKVLNLWDEFYKGLDIKVIGFPIWTAYFNFTGNLNEFPTWKAKFIEKNRQLYLRNKEHIDLWMKKHDDLKWVVKTHRKMEWQAGDKYKSIYDCLIQFRPSGVRVKRPDRFSTLVAMNHQQIIGKLKRKITIEEAKLLQSFPKEYILNQSNSISMKQLGNSVNVKVVKIIFSILKDKFL